MKNFAGLHFRILLLLLCSSGVKAGDTLVSSVSPWKYLDNGSNQGTAWYQPLFNDSAWSTGYSQFGYGDNDEITLLSFGSDPNNKYITSYFRTNFNVVNNSIYQGLRLYLKRDDGAVLYLNGHEVYRSNMPTDTIFYNTEADYNVEPGTEEYFILIRLDPAFIQTGNNVLAVEIHQSSVTSDDLSFDLTLIGDSEGELMRGPYLQSATTHSMKICYRTSVPDISKIYYGSTTAYTDSVIDTTLVIDHTVELSGLTSGTKYFYSVNTSQKQIVGDSTNYFYTTPDLNSNHPVRIWATGDMGSGNRHQLQTRDAYYTFSWNKYTDILLWLGDNAYPYSNDENYSANIFTNHYEDLLKKSVVFSAVGNHDLLTANSSTGTGVYFNIFDFPKNGECGGMASGKESYYSFNYSNIHFVCLESNIDSIGHTNASYMLSWLQQDLSANTLPWTIAYFHIPPYSKGFHDSDIEDDPIYMRENVNPILEAYNVDLVLTGHSHDYERSYLLKGHFGNSASLDSTMIVNSSSGTPPFTYNKLTALDSGTVYAVIGNASELTPVQPDWPHPAMYKSLDSVYGSLVIDVNGDSMLVKMLTDSMMIADEFAIVKNITTGISKLEKENSDYVIYPQPVSADLNIHCGNRKVTEINIFNELGKSVKKKSAMINADNIRINVSDLPGGIYYVRITESGANYIRKFVKL